MIETINFPHEVLRFSTPASRKLGWLFPFGSLNLLIGINGSGKTRLLTQTAQILSGGASFPGEGSYTLFNDPENKRRSDAVNPPSGYGVVYYTSLPYRRQIPAHQNFVDASPPETGRKPLRSLRTFKHLANELHKGAEVELFGELSYRKTIFSKAIVPALLNSKVQLNDEFLNEMLVELRKRRPTILSALGEIEELNPDAEPFAEPFSRGESTRRTKQFSLALGDYVIQRLDERGTFYATASLSSLEKLYIQSANKGNLVEEFFSYHDFLTGPIDFYYETRKYDEILGSTYSFLMDRRTGAYDVISSERNIIQFKIDSNTEYQRIFASDAAIELNWHGLSSGLLALIDQFENIQNAITKLALDFGKKKIVLLIDEGDAFLHLDWQRKYIKLLSQFLNTNAKMWPLTSLQVLIATHSPILAGDLPRCMVQNLSDKHGRSKTFGTSLDDIVYQCFQSNSFGEFASDHIRVLHEKAKTNQLTEQDRDLIDEIGDPSIKAAILS